MAQASEHFSSRWGILLATLGMAVGTGNIWRFPRVAAENGGGAFLIAWLIFLFAWSVPLVMAEFAMGKHTRKGPAGAVGALVGGKYNWMGVFVGACTCFILFYYSVVTGWCLRYFFASAGGGLSGVDAISSWESFTGSLQPTLFHLLAIGVACLIVHRGVVNGIERTNRLLIPVLFFLLMVAALRAVVLPGATQGLAFLFTPVWSDLLQYRVWLEALSQSAWSVGAAWGLVMTYGVYLREKDDFVTTSYTAGFGDYSASLLAGIAVMCTIFSQLPEADARMALGAGNEGLTFIWLPPLFQAIPGGRLFLALFFLALSFAAISSLIAMVELASRMCGDLGMRRRRAVPLVGTVTFLMGLPSALSLSVFKNQDWVWGLGLTVSGFFVAFTAFRFGVERFRTELINTADERRPVGRWLSIVLAYVVPVEFAALIAWWFYQAATIYDPEGWWNPFHMTSVGTCLLQWGLLIALLILMNRWWTRRVGVDTAGKGEEAWKPVESS